jgi:ferredoxin/flavodoxin---NADP+ reductase
MPELYDVTIIGAGPAGMFAAYYAGFRKLKTKLVDSLTEVGGQVTALYPDKDIYDVAGFKAITGKDLVQGLNEQMMQYSPALALGEQARELHRESDGTFTLVTDQARHATRAVVIAGGIGCFTPRKLERAECAAYEGRGLHYVMENPAQYAGKNVAIVGGGDSAVDWANHLAGIGAKVYVIHRRAQFRAHEASVEQMLPRVELRAPAQIKEIRGQERVESLVLAGSADRDEEVIAVDAVLAFLGFVSNMGPLASWGLETNKNNILINHRCETNLPGVYAIGDCAYFEGKVKLIAVGFGEAATAINNLAVYLDPTKSVFPGHSSNQKESA